ncbi:MAG: hypothetical protein J7L15_05655 [Clostridiales bacterium]|nr:hypothetical protein [Clostridiales bacterium]
MFFCDIKTGELEPISFYRIKSLNNLRNRIAKGEYEIMFPPKRGSYGKETRLSHAAGSSGARTPSPDSISDKIIQEAPSVKFEGDGWIIVSSEKS